MIFTDFDTSNGQKEMVASLIGVQLDTASSPVWWAEMWNTLRADPVIRERYQFWAFNYASGKPITMSANILRDELMHEVTTLDPEKQDAALRSMVVIGHSQGGLLANRFQNQY